ncbi:MAG: hypothetical protein H5T84_10530 [Thermoleophilia bacterium]|nr:hypothetical protein [Thermoleophilia bacterium]
MTRGLESMGAAAAGYDPERETTVTGGVSGRPRLRIFANRMPAERPPHGNGQGAVLNSDSEARRANATGKELCGRRSA